MPLSDKQKSIAQAKLLTRRIKDLVIAFIRMEADQEMQFKFEGDVERARKLVQSMRVKLSRMRTEVRRRRLELKDFKMRLKEISYDPETNISVITLTKTAPIAEVEKEINEIFNNEGNCNAD